MAAANPNRGRPSDREATRNAIIDAARRVAARDGMAEVSLSRVAAEADFAPGVVYGHFRSKNELLLSVVANDLTAMASEMRETGWPEDRAESEAQPALPLGEPVALPNSIAEVPAEPEAVSQENVEPFAGNAGLSAVARALSDASSEDIATVTEAEAILPEEDVEPFAADEIIVDEPAPVEEQLVEETVPAAEETVERIRPEDDLEVFSNEYAHAETFAPPAAPMISNAIIEDALAPVAKTGFDAVLPEDDLDPFGNDAAPVHVFGRRHVEHAEEAAVENKETVAEQPVEESAVEPETIEQQPAEEPVSEHQEVVELVEAVSVDEPAPALVEDPVLEAIDDGDENKGPDFAIQNMPAVQKKRQERTQLNDIINRLVMPDATTATGTSGAISRLDRRMSVFEKALADMEVRYGAIERDNEEAITTVANNVKALTSRVEAGEKRALEITAELRGGVLDAATRLAAVEAIMASTKMGADSTSIPRNEALSSEPPKPEIAFTPTPIAKPEPRFSEQKTNGNDFLSAARRSAAVAVPVEVAEEKDTGSNRMRYLLGGGSVLVLVLAVGGYFISEHSNQAKHTPVAHVKHNVVRAPVAASKVMTQSAPVAQMPAQTAQTSSVPTPVAQTQPAPAPVAPPIAVAPVPEPAKAPKASHKHKTHLAAAHIAVPRVAPVYIAPVQAPTQPAQTDAAPLDHLTALARSGNAKAQTIVGLQYLDNGDDAASKAAAAHWLHEAAQKGDPIAQYRLGTLYQRGHGVPADTIEAMHWYEAAAKQGNVKAMYNLGLAYVQTAGAPKDYAQAARWFTLAANLGFVDAQFNLAVLYERGAGVPQSLVDAYKWYAIAGAQGDGVSRERITALGTQLNADDLAQAQHAAQAFNPSAPDRAVNTAPGISDLN